MIAAHELRVGSEVLDGDFIRTITGIVYLKKGAQVYLDGAESSCPLDTVQPVPLSKALIAECGFEESEEGLWYEYDYETLYPIYLMVINGNWDFSLSDPREVAIWKRISFLHQLQNLHLALSGDELALEI